VSLELAKDDIRALNGFQVDSYLNSQSKNKIKMLVTWNCSCCKEGKRSTDDSWIFSKDLIRLFQLSEDKVRASERTAIREFKEKETKRLASEFSSFLQFDDISNLSSCSEFKEVFFSSDTISI